MTQPRRYGQSSSSSRPAVQRAAQESASRSESESDEPAAAADMGATRPAQTTDVRKKAATLVRLALALHARHAIIRREDIIKVIALDAPVSQTLLPVLEEAKRSLARVFGMDLVPVQSAGKAWTLVSALSSAQASSRMQEVLAPNGSDTLTGLQVDEAAQEALVDWDERGESNAIGILQVVLALILGSGRVMTDAALHAHLKKLGLTSNSPLEIGTTNAQSPVTLARLLNSLTKQSYLDYRKVTVATSGSGAPKRRRTGPSAGAGVDDDGLQAEWRWGARAHAEIGEATLAEWVGVVYGGLEAERAKVAGDFLKAGGE